MQEEGGFGAEVEDEVEDAEVGDEAESVGAHLVIGRRVGHVEIGRPAVVVYVCAVAHKHLIRVAIGIGDGGVDGEDLADDLIESAVEGANGQSRCRRSEQWLEPVIIKFEKGRASIG